MQSEFYREYMKSEKWQYKKAQRLEIDGYSCVMCGRPQSKCKTPLQVHHTTYKRLGNENVYTDLCTLCGTCHKREHNLWNRRRN